MVEQHHVQQVLKPVKMVEQHNVQQV